MEIALWMLVAALTIAFAYTMQFSAATLSMGKALSNSGSKTGFQDAITPPWQTNLALTVYVGIAVVVGVMWWWLGWISALVAFGIILFGGGLLKFVLSKQLGNHYQHLILQSMAARYTNYIRDGDVLRADAMKQLLGKAGIDPVATGADNNVGKPPQSLRRISQQLGRRMNLGQSLGKRLADSDRYAKAEEALLDYCESQPAIQSVTSEFQISRHDLQELYDWLVMQGAGQWRSGHWVAASALAYPESLRYILLRREENPLETAANLITYFEQGITLGGSQKNSR